MTPKEYLAAHGINQDSVEKFGLVLEENRITIPILDDEGEVVYNKYRHLSGDGGKYSFDKGSHPSLFNTIAITDKKNVFLTEGEFDAIRLDQEGVGAVSSTAGAGTFEEEWIEHFENKKVYIVYDNDQAGRDGAAKIAELIPNAIIITLPEGTKDICEYFQRYTMVDFKKLVTEQTKEQTITYDQLCEVVDKWLLLPDKNILRILMATMISHHLSSDPLWMFFVAPPSGSKTEVISMISTLPFVRMLSDLTAQTLASGMITKKDPSLLLQLKNHVLVMKDFTTVLQMRRDDRQMIFSQLREVYDGRYVKAFGTGKVIDWEGRVTLIAGVTPIIDTYSSVFQVMGERFIMYRVPQSDAEEVADKALLNYGSEKLMRAELKEAMRKYFLSIDIPDINEVELPDEIRKAVASLATFIVKARSGVVRNQYNREIEYIPETEAPSRFAKQLGSLIKSLTILRGKKVVTWEDYYMTLRVALDVVPANRMNHFLALCGTSYGRTISEISGMTGYSHTGTKMQLEDLEAVKLAKGLRSGSSAPGDWKLNPDLQDIFKKILPVYSDKIKDVIPEDHPYTVLINEMLGEAPAATTNDEEMPWDK